MGFEDKDREKLTQVHTDVQWIKKNYGERLQNLESEDKSLHHRINVVHSRVNKIKFISGVFVAAGSAIGSFLGFVTTKGSN